MPSPLSAIIDERAGRSWCLFLDRDGVVNARIQGGYVTKWSEFHFESGVLDALRVLASWAPRIVLVTNQQGVGKGLMSEDDLAAVHALMLSEIVATGGRIDAIRFCPHLDADACGCRKPRAGMASGYLAEHPEIDGALSLMIGDTASDVEMGRRLSLETGGGAAIRIAAMHDPAADFTSPSLAALATAVAAHLASELHTAE